MINEPGVEASLKYLASPEAFSTLRANVYWPKWNAPWWHLTTLHEMGLIKNAPRALIDGFVEQMKASPLKVFLIDRNEIGPSMELGASCHCHCSLGNIYQALAAYGVNVDQELPWIRKWFLSYQLPDGGYHCDDEVYSLASPPSSMVGTIAVLEAVLLYTNHPLTSAEEALVDRAAECLLNRKLMHATLNPANLDEKEDEADWLKLCFPRFYFYDVLRGLNVVLEWADRRDKSIPRSAIQSVTDHIRSTNPDGKIRIRRHSFEGCLTRLQNSNWEWKNRGQASHFELMDRVSGLGQVSPHLTANWTRAQALISKLSDRNAILADC
jgi:hypothetical protein